MKNIKSNQFSRLLIIIASTGLLFSAACSQKMEKKIVVTDPNTGEKANVSISKNMFSNDKEINITSEKDGGSVKISQGSMPANMPPYVELYPGAKELTSVLANENKAGKDGNKGKITMISFKSKDAPTKIIEFYTAKLSAHGYKNEASMNLGGMQMATLTNEATKQGLQIMVTQEPSKDAVVQLIYATND